MMPNAVELELLTGETDIPEGAASTNRCRRKNRRSKTGRQRLLRHQRRRKKDHTALQSQVVDTTGAGDAFNAGFLYGLIHNKTLGECGRLGNFVASRSVMKMGAREGLPYEKIWWHYNNRTIENLSLILLTLRNAYR